MGVISARSASMRGYAEPTGGFWVFLSSTSTQRTMPGTNLRAVFFARLADRAALPASPTAPLHSTRASSAPLPCLPPHWGIAHRQQGAYHGSMSTHTTYAPLASVPTYAPRPTHYDVPAVSDDMRAMTALLTDGEYTDTRTTPTAYTYDRTGHRITTSTTH